MKAYAPHPCPLKSFNSSSFWAKKKKFIYSVIIFRTAMHLAAERGHTSTVEFLAG
jgi:hypothetical protein